ncbi:MAG: hypothetical protein ACAI25_16765, partial [Planctomycetota bacterium]
MRRRRGLVAAAAAVVVAVVGAVAFIEAREPARPERAYGAEEAGDPPPYPFLEPDPGPVERRFKQQKLNLNLDGTPFAEVLGVLKDLTSVPVELDPSVAAAIGTATVTLKVRDITVERALLLVLASCPVDVLPCFERTKVLVLPASRVPPRPLWQRVSTEEIFKGWRGGELEPTWVHEYKKRLATQRLTFNFSATPLSEAVQFFQDFTSLNVAVDKVVDTEATKLDLVLRGVLAEEALAAVCSAAGLEARFKNEAIYL